MKKIFVLCIALSIFVFCGTLLAQEKPLIVKGLYLGMDVKEAHEIMTKLLNKDWRITPIGDSDEVLSQYRFGEGKIFGSKENYGFSNSTIGDRGFAIISKYDSHEGFISSDKNNKVTRISFGGELSNAIFSASSISADEFAPSFWKNYNMPDFGWIPHGWQYKSPAGYIITIKTDKYLDIKKDSAFRINFN